GMGGGMMGMGGMGRPGGGGWGGQGGNSNAMNFVVGQQGGISTTHSIGANYSDVWGKNTLVTASYFFNATDNDASSELSRTFFSKIGAGQNYNEDKRALSDNNNHRVNLRIEHFVDSMNSFVFNPRISFQNNNSNNNTQGLTSLVDTLLSSLNSDYKSKNQGFNSNNSLLYRKRFKKYGRTFSAQINADLNEKNGNTNNLSLNNYFTQQDSIQNIDQNADNSNGGRTYGTSLSYTEPIGKYFAAQIVYNPSLNYNFANKKTFNYDTLTNRYTSTDTLLSNEYGNTITTQKGGVNFRVKTEKLLFGFGGNYQEVILQGEQTYPINSNVKKTFNNFLPMATFQYRFSKTSNLRMNYRTSTNLPTVNQLQDVIDNSNTLMLSTGNSDLRQNFSHFVMSRFNYTNPTNSRSFFFFIMGNWVEDYIGNSTFIARKDTLLTGDILLRQGSQLSRPINLSGNRTFRCYTTFSSPIKKIKSTLNVNLGFSYNDLPGLINGKTNIASTTAYNSGLVLASNISEKLDFTVTWNGYYNLVTNSLQTNSNNNYYYHITTAKLNWNFYKSFHLASDLNYTFYDGLQGNFTQEFMLWNSSIAYKFLKNNSGEIKFSIFDALKQNNSVGRNVTETFIEDTQTRVLQRYYLLTFTWNFRKFNKEENNKDKKNSDNSRR
ncbi:MAG: outer membrane beta-barrel protein, partial [Bacteroidota bacterium]